MATRTLQTISIHRQDGKDGIIHDYAPGEEESQTYKKGAPLVLDGTSKELEEWVGGGDGTSIVGIAVKDATGETGARVPYYEANDYNLFEVSMINDTSAYTLAGTELGTDYSLIKSGDNWYLDENDESTTKMVVVSFVDAVDDINPRVVARFLQAKQALVP